MYQPIKFIQLSIPELFYFALIFSLLSACSKEPKALPTTETKISGMTINFAADSEITKRLITSTVIPAQADMIRLPARIVWNEDHTSRVTSPIAGRMSQIMVQTGSKVEANQPLAYLNSPELGIAQSEAMRAHADLKQAEHTHVRTKELAAEGVVATKDMEQAEADLAHARAEASRTELRLKSMGANNTVDQRYAIRSPINGLVVERNTNPGMEWRPDLASPPLFIVSDPSYLWCWIDAPERLISMLHPGMKVVLQASAWPQEKFEAQIELISDALDPVSRTIKIRAKLRNPERHLKEEMYVTAEITGQVHGALAVPAKAVFLNNEDQQVFVKTGPTQYTRKTITPVARNDQWISIADGLSLNDLVVVDGALYLEKLLEGKATQQSAMTPSTTISLTEAATPAQAEK